MGPANSSNKLWRCGDVVKLLGATAITGPMILRGTTASAATSKVIKIGHVSSQTGVFAPFAEADPFILNQIRTALAKGITNGEASYEVQVITKDNQSNTNRASEVASDLILRDKVDLLVSSGPPATTNAVADQAEADEVPCITGMTPWQSYFFGRHGIPDKGFTWTYHFAFGLEDIIGSFLALWKAIETNKVLGALFPNDIGGTPRAVCFAPFLSPLPQPPPRRDPPRPCAPPYSDALT